MKAVAAEHLPANAAATGELYPSFWDSPSFAQNLKWAYEGFKGDPKLAKPGQILVEEFLTLNNGIPPKPGDYIFKKTKLSKRRFTKQ
jgi:hypothetical protein